MSTPGYEWAAAKWGMQRVRNFVNTFRILDCQPENYHCPEPANFE